MRPKGGAQLESCWMVVVNAASKNSPWNSTKGRTATGGGESERVNRASTELTTEGKTAL